MAYLRSIPQPTEKRYGTIDRKRQLTVPRVSKLLLIYEPSLRRSPVVSVFELSDPARSIKFWRKLLVEELSQK